VSFAEHSKFSAFVNFDKYIPVVAWTNFQPNNTRHNDQGDKQFLLGRSDRLIFRGGRIRFRHSMAKNAACADFLQRVRSDRLSGHPIEDRVSGRRYADHVVPGIHRNLAGDQRRTDIILILDDLFRTARASISSSGRDDRLRLPATSEAPQPLTLRD
jgi:hypothetical protein